MAERPAPYSHFRLNFEQQQKRAKDLLRAARAGDADALARFRSLPPKLSEAQYLIARELRFDDWTHLKRHIAAMTREREALEAIPPSANAATARASAERTSALDGSLRTLHVRCGSDIRQALLEAGFSGDFYEHACDCASAEAFPERYPFSGTRPRSTSDASARPAMIVSRAPT